MNEALTDAGALFVGEPGGDIDAETYHIAWQGTEVAGLEICLTQRSAVEASDWGGAGSGAVPYNFEDKTFAIFEEVGAPPDLIFADGFESGDTSAWSATVP